MWIWCFFLSIGVLTLALALAFLVSNARWWELFKRRKPKAFNLLLGGAFVAALLLFCPIHSTDHATLWLSVLHAVQVMAAGCEFTVVSEGLGGCDEWLTAAYMTWAAALCAVAPLFTFGFVLSFFKNLSARLRYLLAFFCDAYVFSELNEQSLALASDIKRRHKHAAIVFTDVFDSDEEIGYERIERAKRLGAICFKDDVLVVNFKTHAPQRNLLFFTIGADETENLNQSLKLIENYRTRQNTHLYVFSTGIESALLLTRIDKGAIKVRRINEVQSLINRILYERGDRIFGSARETDDGTKLISAVVVGMGRHGTEMVKALTWFGQMDGYRLEINAFDRDPLAEETFTALAPELMSPAYNGVVVEGEAQYRITVHPDVSVETVTFAEEIAKLTDATYVLVALGDDEVNINTAVNLRMYFERMKIHPVIQAIVYNSQQRKALEGIENYRGQAYDIDFIGDTDSSYAEDVIIDSELEDAALARHLKWGKEEEFWTYEYNYRSSMASAIHMKARITCGIPGADKAEDDLTAEESAGISVLEHRRWNAYMRAEGYVYSGSKDKASRNDLAKMHHDLVEYAALSAEEQEKDRKVGSN